MNKQLYKSLLDKTSFAYIFLEVNLLEKDNLQINVLEYNEKFKKHFKVFDSDSSIRFEDIFEGVFLEKLIDCVILALNGKERKIAIRNDAYEYSVEAFYLDKNIVALVFKDRRKQSERRTIRDRSKLLLLDNLPGMVYRCKFDHEWTMQYVSDGCKELTGYNPDSLIGNIEISYNEIILEEYRTEIWNLWNKIIEDKTVFKFEYPIQTKTGHIKWVYEQGQPIFDKNGKVTVLEGVIVDIDEQKNRENRINYLTYRDSMIGIYNRRYYNIAMKTVDSEEYLPLSVIIGDINGLKLINDAFGHEAGDNLIIKTAELLKGCIRNTDILSRTGGDEFAIFLPNTSNDLVRKVVERINDDCIIINNKTCDPTKKVSISLGYYTRELLCQPIDEIIKLAEDHMYKNKLFEHKSTHNDIINSIMSSLFGQNGEDKENFMRLKSIANYMATRLELNNEMRENLIVLLAVHDIGKIAIDTEVLNKEEPLTSEEWKIIKKHPEMGFRIAMASIELATIAEYILAHHERWDVKGYPDGLKQEEIPFLSRIIAIVDAYDAMLTDKPYKKKLTKEQAIEELKKNAGTQFDPKLVEEFVNSVEIMST
ncbi:MAG: diguanylate cyclase [Gudongella sp.]|nr:diguanylate cyclase [Gudongella sp.]